MHKNSRNAQQTRHQQAHPKAGAHFSPRSLYRGMTIPYSDRPGQKYLHPERRRKDHEPSRAAT